MDAATAWYAGTSTNYGVALKYLSGNATSMLLHSDEAESAQQPYFTVEYIFIEEGTYFIQNVATGKYIDVEGPSTATGAAIQQWNFHGDDQSKWNLVYISNDRYRIQSVYSDLYMRCNGTPAVTQTNIGNIYGLWKFEVTSSGNYRIICAGASESTNSLSVASSSAGNGSDLVMTGYTDDSDYCDEWILYRMDYTLNLDVLYDYAYINRYSNAINRIQSNLLVFQEKYLTEFGILINASSPNMFASYGDTDCSSNPTFSCTHADDELCYNSVLYTNGNISLQSYHHKNLYNMMLRIPLPDTSSTLRIAFLGHDNCVAKRDENGNLIEHRENPYYGLAYSSRGLATITNFSSQSSEIKTLIHEFGHFYGVDDHYGGDVYSTLEIKNQTGNNGYNKYCIYGEKKEDETVLSNYIICDGCKSVIEANRGLYNHN